MPTDGHVRDLQSKWETLLEGRCQSGEMAIGTCSSYVRGVERYLGWCDEMARVWAERDSVEVWRQGLHEKGYSVSSVNTWSAGVKTFFAWAVAEGELGSDPAQGLPALKAEVMARSRTTPLTDRQVRSILDEPDSSEIGVRDRAILALMAYAAARVVDVQQAHLGGLEQLDGQWRLVFAEGQESIYIAHQEAVEALEEWLAVHPLAQSPEAALFVALGNRARGQRLTGRAIRRLVRERMRDAGVLGKSAMSLRASAICNALRQGLTLDQVRGISRHKSMDSLSAYATDDRTLREIDWSVSAAIQYDEAED